MPEEQSILETRRHQMFPTLEAPEIEGAQVVATLHVHLAALERDMPASAGR
jgi:hypothetical protein